MSNATLCLHKGAEHVTLEQLRLYPTPEDTRSWFPISHAKVVDVATESLEAAGYQIKKADYGVYKDGSRFFGVLNLESSVTTGVGLAIGLRNSVDRSLRVSMCAGNRVFVCDNMAFSSEISITRKHTRFAMRDFSVRMQESVAKLSDFRAAEAERVERMRGMELKEDRAHSLILAANIKGLLPHHKMGDVLQQWNEPACDWGGHTSWRLLNAFTYVLKDAAERNADRYAATTMKLQALILGQPGDMPRGYLAV